MTGSRTRACFTCVSHMRGVAEAVAETKSGRSHRSRRRKEVYQAPYAQQGHCCRYDNRENDFDFCIRHARHACLDIGRLHLSCPCMSVINALTCDSTIGSFASAGRHRTVGVYYRHWFVYGCDQILHPRIDHPPFSNRSQDYARFAMCLRSFLMRVKRTSGRPTCRSIPVTIRHRPTPPQKLGRPRCGRNWTRPFLHWSAKESTRLKAMSLRVCFSYESIAFAPACNGTHFQGYDVQLWDDIMVTAGYVLGRDWERICVGSSGFTSTIEDLSEYTGFHVSRNDTDRSTTVEALGAPRPAQVCDVLASGTAVTVERTALMGLKFTRPIMRAPLSALVSAPVDNRGIWEFFRPLTWHLWLSMLATILLLPLAVVCVEYFLTDKNKYRYERWRWRGRWRILFMLGEGIWESTGHFLQTHHFPAQTAPARLLVAAYAFTSLVFSSTYLANLAAWTTQDRLLATTTFNDLRGHRVGLFYAFQDIVEQTLRLKTTVIQTEGRVWTDSVRTGIQRGDFFAVVFYDHALRIVAEESPNLQVISESGRILDIAFPFRRTYPYEGVRANVDRALISLLETGRLTALQKRFDFRSSESAGIVAIQSSVPVPLSPLLGLWVIYGVAVFVAMLLAAIRVLTAYNNVSRRQDARTITMRARDIGKTMDRAAFTNSNHSNHSNHSDTVQRQSVHIAATSSALYDCKLRLGDTLRDLERIMDMSSNTYI